MTVASATMDLRVCRYRSLIRHGAAIGFCAATRRPARILGSTRDFIVTKLGAERYSTLADQSGMEYMRIARVLGKEAL